MRIKLLLVISSLLISLTICITTSPYTYSMLSAQKESIDMDSNNLGKDAKANLSFRLATDIAKWKVPGKGANDATTIDMQLIIMNNTLSKVALYLLDTVSIEMKTADGANIPMDGGRDIIFKSAAPIIYIEPGKSYQLSRSGSLSWAKAGSILRLIGYDDFGGVWYFEDLHRGNYLIRVVYENTKNEVNGIKLWRGRGVTNSIGIQIF
jgi:hypothetical protein